MDTLPRPPVVVVLGHVDHGKTTLLDAIRKTNQTAQEVGGITQRIGAYEATPALKEYPDAKITFIDTPGHEAFSILRSRGAQVADIALLVVDAVDSVMPQTIEAISHIKNAAIPFIVVANKIDLPNANVDKVKKELARHDVLVEGMGGEAPIIPVSAQKGTGLEKLLETLLFIASVQELTFSPQNQPSGVIIESQKDKQGPAVSVILKDGRLSVGDLVYADREAGKVKALINDRGEHLKIVSPSTPFLLLGFKNLPPVGAVIATTPPTIASSPQPAKTTDPAPGLEKLLAAKAEAKKLSLIIKTNAQGALDAILANLAKNNTIDIILATVGDISKSDIFLAKTTKAIIIGFGLSFDKTIRQLAEEEKVVVKTYDLIYELFQELTEVSALIHEKEKKKKQLKGEAKILAQFLIEKERVAGIKVSKGKLNLNDTIEIYRDKQLLGKAKIVSLKIRAKPVSEVKKNDEAGAIFYPQLDFVPNDVIQSHSI